jgi:hypothetical protein
MVMKGSFGIFCLLAGLMAASGGGSRLWADDPVHRQNYDLPRNQSDRSVASFVFLSVSNWFHAAPAEASVRMFCPVILLSARFALGESGLAATTRRFEGETPAASLFHL